MQKDPCQETHHTRDSMRLRTSFWYKIDSDVFREILIFYLRVFLGHELNDHQFRHDFFGLLCYELVR